MKRIIVLFMVLVLFPFVLLSQKKMSTKDYIEKYKTLAIDGMDQYGIPASIKMAQAIIESSSGNSRLAQVANNHFGIKCKTTWDGQTISHDDDEKDECFRKYQSTEDSFLDHSEFLSNSPRYQSLFEIDAKDYKSWARGLKAAGYATNPAYADVLIRTIEENELYNLDNEEVVIAEVEEPAVEIKVEAPKEEIITVSSPQVSHSGVYNGPRISAKDYVVYKPTPVPIYRNNNTNFVIAKDGDTFDSISKMLKISKTKLMQYNDLRSLPGSIRPSSIVYISKKQKKAANGYAHHIVERGDDLQYVSQKYGIQLSKLATLNNVDVNYKIKPGQKLVLR